jgi:DNA replication protein DnaC
MNTIIQQLSTIITLYITDIIKIENRMLGNALITIISSIIIGSINYLYLNWRDIYNSFIYFLYDMDKYPLQIWRAPYLYNFIIIPDNFQKQYYVSQSIEYIKDINVYNEINRKGDLGTYFWELIKKSGVSPVMDNLGKTYFGFMFNNLTHFYKINPNSNEKGLYLISIDKFGNPIYYCSDRYIYYKNKVTFVNIENEISKLIINDFNKRSCEQVTKPNGIYVFDRKNKKEIGTVSEKKTFETLFYTQKEDLINILNKFKKGNLYPSHVPMDNKLGILLYGPPGTGKTGTISAISNYLQRNITVINFTEISNIDDFESVFNPQGYKNTIYIFDEFDCILNALGSNSKSEIEKKDWGSMLLAAEGDERKQIIEIMRTDINAVKKSLNLAYLLQKLDGLESSDGRIIIATTNNPDKINPALLRPGRFDIKVCLSNCTTEMYCKILGNYYKNETGVTERILNASIPELMYSPLEIINLAIQNNTLNELLGKLKQI